MTTEEGPSCLIFKQPGYKQLVIRRLTDGAFSFRDEDEKTVQFRTGKVVSVDVGGGYSSSWSVSSCHMEASLLRFDLNFPTDSIYAMELYLPGDATYDLTDPNNHAIAIMIIDAFFHGHRGLREEPVSKCGPLIDLS